MDAKRQGEIALLIVRYMIRRRGVMLSHDTMREFGNIAKSTGIPVEELKQFARPLLREFLDECFQDGPKES